MLKSLIASAIGLMLCVSAHAERVPLMRVTAQAFPGEEYFIGIETDTAHRVTGVYYEDRYQMLESDRVQQYSLQRVLNGVVLKKKDKYELIKLSVKSTGKNEYSIDLDFMTNGMFNHRGHAFLGMRWSERNAAYELYYKGNQFDDEDKSDGSIVNSAYIVTRFVPLTKKQLGIARIEFSRQ